MALVSVTFMVVKIVDNKSNIVRKYTSDRLYGGFNGILFNRKTKEIITTKCTIVHFHDSFPAKNTIHSVSCFQQFSTLTIHNQIEVSNSS